MDILKSISNSLSSTNRTTGPIVKNDTITYYPTSTATSDFAFKTINILHNLCPAKLYEHALKESNTIITSSGALAAFSGRKTGRSPKDKRVVYDNNTKDICWGDNSPNIMMDANTFLINRETAICYLNNLDNIFVFDGYAGWNQDYRIKVRVISERAYHSLFMHNMLIRPTKEELISFGEPDYIIYNSGTFPCNRFTGNMTSSTSIDFDFTRKEIVILGTQYAGEMKKGIFSVMHYLMPKQDILSLHSSVNEGIDGDITIFFGLSGTGKTTLSSDPVRKLIGDDEHCWSDNGVFNIEGGCYAKCINLTKESEPEIWESIKFGSLLENISYNDNHDVDYTNCDITPNTRVAFPINFNPNAKIPCIGTHPKNIILLTCDAYGILPVISKLTPEQTMYYFISGYTSKIAGTEEGIKEPEATFSACFGEAFIVWDPLTYANLLCAKIKKHKCNIWLINTGWIGGEYGTGNRCKLQHTRNIIDAIHNDELIDVEYENLPIFNLQIPTQCPNIEKNMLNPQNLWSDKSQYDQKLKNLATLFIKNFNKYDLPNIQKFGPSI